MGIIDKRQISQAKNTKILKETTKNVFKPQLPSILDTLYVHNMDIDEFYNGALQQKIQIYSPESIKGKAWLNVKGP